MLLEDALAAADTKDDLLVNRILRYHWDRNYIQQLKGAYRHLFSPELGCSICERLAGVIRVCCLLT
jgi:annexin A7/11